MPNSLRVWPHFQQSIKVDVNKRGKWFLKKESWRKDQNNPFRKHKCIPNTTDTLCTVNPSYNAMSEDCETAL